MNKQENLTEILRSLGRVAVAFSGGVDSTYLLKVAKEALGDGVIAVTASSRAFPAREYDEADRFCKDNNISHYIVEIDEMSIEGFKENPVDRCYICKKAIFQKIIAKAKEHGFENIVEASNIDDNSDYRPGMIAVKELGVFSPLRSADMTKADIRFYSKELDLPTWKKPSFACLATRFVYGEPITEEKLVMVDKAEQLLIDMGFEQVRVRVHGNIARIEVEASDIDRIMELNTRTAIYEEFRRFGFQYVTLDMQGYRTGSMNEILSDDQLRKGKQ